MNKNDYINCYEPNDPDAMYDKLTIRNDFIVLSTHLIRGCAGIALKISALTCLKMRCFTWGTEENS